MRELRNGISFSTTSEVASLLATPSARNDEKESALTGTHRLGTPGLYMSPLESVGVLWYYRSDYTERRLI